MYKDIMQTLTLKMVRSIMGMLHAAHYSCMIAGGYLRDEVTGKPQKDVDVLVRIQDNQNWFSVFNLLRQLGSIMKFEVFDKDNPSYSGKTYYTKDDSLVRVLGIRFENKEVMDIDIIIIKVPFIHYVRDRFPTNASQIYSYDGVRAFWGASFQRFFVEKVMYYTGTNFQEGYRERMQAKYPECIEEFAEGFNPEGAKNAKSGNGSANEPVSNGLRTNASDDYQSVH